MTNSLLNVPLLLRFGERLPAHTSTQLVRYNANRQVSEVLVNGSWIDVADTNHELAGTRLTEIGRETTDDQ